MPDRLPVHRPPRATFPGPVHGDRPHAAARGYGATWRKLRLMVLRREPLCRRCGAAALDVDHIIPRRRGGPDSLENLQALCHPCHSRKTATEDS